MKFEKYIIGINGREYLLKCEVNGRISNYEVDILNPEERSVTVPCVDDVVFSDLTVLSEDGKTCQYFESFAVAPDYISERTIKDIKEEAEEALLEELTDSLL